MKIKYNTNILNSYSSYSMRLEVLSRFQQPLYKIVVTNPNNRIVATLGYYNPFKLKFRTTYRNVQLPLFHGKVVAIDRINTIVWLRKGVVPSSIFLCFLLYDMGLLKTQSSSLDLKLSYHKWRSKKRLPFFFEKLLRY
jgi:ribosomal protein S16